MNPHCDPLLEDSNPIFLHDTLAHDDASPYQVWLQKIQQLGKYIIQMNIHWNSEPFLWPSPPQNNPIFSQDNPAYDDVPSNQVYLQKSQHLRRYLRKLYFDFMFLHCDLELEDSTPIFLHDTLAHDVASP